MTRRAARYSRAALASVDTGTQFLPYVFGVPSAVVVRAPCWLAIHILLLAHVGNKSTSAFCCFFARVAYNLLSLGDFVGRICDS